MTTRPQSGSLKSLIGVTNAVLTHNRKAFETQVAEYVKEHFENGAGVVYGTKNNDGSYTLTTCISAVLLNPNNF